MGSGKRNKKKKNQGTPNTANSNTDTNKMTTTMSSPGTSPFYENHFDHFETDIITNKCEERINLSSNSPFPSPILSPTPIVLMKEVVNVAATEEKLENDDDEETTRVKLNFEPAAATKSPASDETKIEKLESILGEQSESVQEQTTTQSYSTIATTNNNYNVLLLETNRDLRLALADSVLEISLLEEELERVKKQLQKELDSRPYMIAEACEDLCERLKKAEVAIERERRDSNAGKNAWTELNAMKKKIAEDDRNKTMTTSKEEDEREREKQVLKDALGNAEDRIIVMFAELNASKVELNRLREENSELNATKVTRNKDDNALLISPRSAVQEELELAKLMKKNAEQRDRESFKKMEEAEKQIEAASRVVEKLKNENEQIRREYENLKRSMNIVLAEENPTIASAPSEVVSIDDDSFKKVNAVRKRERPSVFSPLSLTWYFVSGGDKAPILVANNV